MREEQFTCFLTREDLVRRGITYTNTHLLRLERRDRFPKRVQLGPNRVAWVEREIEAWLQQRIADRDRLEPVNHRPEPRDGPRH
jgi:prophage regulatory protein